MTSGKYLDDLSVGDTFETGGVTLTEGGIIDFALVYDPQPFHIDKVEATESIFGDLIASGFQTIALCAEGAALGEGCDTIRARVTVEAITPSRSKPDRGVVRFRYRSYNQDDVEVLSVSMDHVVARRTAGEFS